MTIAAYFSEHEDRKERGNFVKSFFDGVPVEKTLSNGQTAGYRAYDDLLHLWRGNYESREAEVYIRWQMVADDIYGMILTEQWLSPDERPLPTEGEQVSMLAETQAEKSTAFTLPQAAIDYVLTHGSGYSHGKYRIYEQFQKGETAEENVRFLKNEYGIGGHSDAIPGTGYWEDHDSKGILIRPNLRDEGSVLLRWPKVEKRIRELIAADRYLSNAEKEAYPEYLNERSLRAEAAETVPEESNTELPESMEATAAEPATPPKEYRITQGVTVHIGAQEYEVVFYGADTVVLQDTRFPLLQTEYSQTDFLKMLAENPLNDQLLHAVEEADEPKQDEVPESAEEINQSDESESRLDEMLRQALLASELAEQTGQDVFAFEEVNPELINVSKPEPAEKEIVLAPPTPRPRSKLTPTMLYPEIKSDYRRDFQITDDRIGVGTPLERFHHNIMAIQLLKKLESEHRLADSNEQRILADYVGWGGLADFFDESNPHYPELREVLTDEELSSARESTLTAFYTPPVVIRAMYQAMENLGFQNGNVLEPSCGIGNFIGMKPESMADARIFGVELDSISGRIAQQLYQKSSIAVQGFEKTELPDSFFDVAIGNIPFGNFKLSDKRYDKHNFLIHDYFFAKTLDKVRPGGIVAFVTSKGTMDKESPAVRKYIAQRAEMLGAVRLPNNTFKDAAGTDVTSDILFLQKRDTLTLEEPDWVHLNTDANGLRMNQYFVDHPEMILGEMREISGPYGPEAACIPYADQDLGELLTEAVQGISGSLTEYETEELAEEDEDLSIPADPSVRNFSYTLVDGKVYYRENSRMTPVNASVTAESRIKGLIGIRECVRQLIAYQTEDYPDTMIEAEQARLNALYDAFSAKYGIINSRANKSVFNTDNSYFLLSSLEVLDDEGNFVRKADMFSRRTIKQRVEITHVDTASEALAVSLAEKAHVDMDYM